MIEKTANETVIALAMEDREGMFPWYLIGFLTSEHEAEMAECARHWLKTHDPEALAAFDKEQGNDDPS